MCIVLSKPANLILPKETLAECFRCNADGAGFAYAGPQGMVIEKGFFTFEKFFEAYEPLQDKEAILHFRIKSHGTVSVDNCHPFAMRSRSKPEFTFALAHNGVLSHRSTLDMSDTRCFIMDIIQPLIDDDPDFFDRPTHVKLLGIAIGSYNKFVIMRHNALTGDVNSYIVNEFVMSAKRDFKSETHPEGCWLSNSSYLLPSKTSTIRGFGSEEWPAYTSHNQAEWGYMDGRYQHLPTAIARKKNGHKPISEMTDAEWEEYCKTKNILKPSQHSKPKEIEVPRDAERFPSRVILDHLNKKQKKLYRRLAQNHCESCFGKAIVGEMTPDQCITWFRRDVRQIAPDETMNMSNKDLDIFILKDYDNPSVIYSENEPTDEQINEAVGNVTDGSQSK